MTRKKILCIIGQLGNGGTEKQLYLFLKHLDLEKYEPFVVVSSRLYIDKWKQRFEKELKVKVSSLSAFPAFAKFAAFKFQLWKIQPDIIFSWSFYTNPLLKVAGNIPFIGSLRGGIEEEREELSKTHFSSALLPKKFVVNSRKLFDELAEEDISADRIATILNIFEPAATEQETENVRDKYDIPADAVLVAGGGRNSSVKDFPLWLASMEKVLANSEQVRGVLFGHGPQAIIGEDIKAKGLDKQITVTGDLPDVSGVLKTSDIFFLSSLYEGLANIVLEAIDAGCALICTDTAGIRDTLAGVEEEILQLVVLPDRDPESAAGALNKLIQDSELRSKVAEATKVSLEKFQPSEIMQKYYAVIEEMLAGKNQ